VRSAALDQLAARWRQQAALFRRYGAEQQAAACDLHADELESALQAAADEPLTFAEAAAESGYSPRRLRELVAAGEIANAGRKGSPRLRRADLPRKATGRATGEYDATADALSLVASRGGLR
jgi:hypothetical protein